MSRQKNDIQYAQLLNRARFGMISPQDVKILKTRLINVESGDVKEALHVYPTRKQVQSYNALRQEELRSSTVKITAEHFYSSQNTSAGGEVPDHLIPEDDRLAGNLPNVLELSVGTRIMLIRNITASTGLVNGALGTVQSFRYTGRILTGILVYFDDESVGQICDKLGHNAVEIQPIDHTFLQSGRIIVRRAFPLIPSWACTIHKVQA